MFFFTSFKVKFLEISCKILVFDCFFITSKTLAGASIKLPRPNKKIQIPLPPFIDPCNFGMNEITMPKKITTAPIICLFVKLQRISVGDLSNVGKMKEGLCFN